MTFALDTNTFSHLLQGHERVVVRHAAVVTDGADEVTLPEVVRIELLTGRFEAVKKAADGGALLRMADYLARTERAVAAYRILPVTEAVAGQFDRLRTAKGLKKIGRADLLIACIALAHGATLVTRNTKDFQGIPNLKLDNWAD